MEEGIRTAVCLDGLGESPEAVMVVHHFCFKLLRVADGDCLVEVGAPPTPFAMTGFLPVRLVPIFFPFHELLLALLEESIHALHIFNTKRFTSITYEFVEASCDLAQSSATHGCKPSALSI